MKLRISHIVVQPVLVYDNGEELIPGPELSAIQLPLSKLVEFADALPAEVARLEKTLDQNNKDPIAKKAPKAP